MEYGVSSLNMQKIVAIFSMSKLQLLQKRHIRRPGRPQRCTPIFWMEEPRISSVISGQVPNEIVQRLIFAPAADVGKAGLGTSIDLGSADKELKAVTPEKSKTCVTAFTKTLVTTFQLSRTRSCHFFLK